MANRRWAEPWREPDVVEGNGTDQLLVFGYQCKLFSDDEKALFIESNKNLIPWMGDPSLMIDRYDGRGHLFDLRPYDAERNRGKYAELTEDEKTIEAALDAERYLEIHTDIAEKQMYEEEELKRLNEAVGAGYGAVGFSYEPVADESEAQPPQEIKKEESDEEEVFEVPSGLKVPHKILCPTTTKQHAIIEKTAQFVAKQGVQLEIVIKTKQQNNPHFDFLDFGNELNPYYKHVVSMLKSGLYKPVPPERKRRSSESNDGKYLHPLLARHQEHIEEHLDSKQFLESVKSKLPSGQIANTLYSKLVNNISKHTGRNSPSTALKLNQPASEIRTATYYAHQKTASDVYEAAYSNHSGIPPPPGMEPVSLPPGVTQPPPPGTQPPPPGTGPLDPLPYAEGSNAGSTKKPKSLVASYAEVYDYNHESGDGYAVTSPPIETQQIGPQLPSNLKPEGPQIVAPPPDEAPVIDKMASYVAKNGPDFEYIVKNKGDKRFDFVFSWHKHNAYYEYKKDKYGKDHKKEKKSNGRQTEEMDNQEFLDQEAPSTSTQSKAVAFTMKSKKHDPRPLKMKTALLYESSDEDDEGESTDKKDSSEGEAVTQEENVYEERPTATSNRPPTDANGLSSEDKLKHKLAKAAREKLAQASKEKQLQAERKRKAAMFAAMLKCNQTASPDATADTMDTEPHNTGPDSSTPSLVQNSSPLSNRSSSPANHNVSKPDTLPTSNLHYRKSRSPSKHSHHSHSRASLDRRSRDKMLHSRSIKRRKSRSPRQASKSPKQKRSKSPSSLHPRKSPIKRRKSRSRSPSPHKLKKKKSKRSRSRSQTRQSSSKSKSSKHNRSPTKRKSKKKKKARSKSRSPPRKECKIPAKIPLQSEPIVIEIDNSDDDIISAKDSDDCRIESEHSDTGASLIPLSFVKAKLKKAVDMFESSPDARSSPFSADATFKSNGNSSPSSSVGISGTNSPASAASKPVSQDMLSKVRAMLRASRAAEENL